jgi:serine/threonine protein kinase
MRAGEIVAERFRIERVAARGASGVVLSAIDETSGARVALKLLLGELEEAALSRFDVETAALQRLAHPAVVRYVAHGRLEGNGAYLAMEWVDGGSLSQRLRSRGLPGRASLGIASTLAEGLAAAHAAGIVHRDVKPGNVLLTKSDISAAKLADFGIARLGLGSTVTSAGTWVGTPRYMPPEQVRDARKVDGRADVFALGCVLFECLTGRNAFPGDDAATTLARILLHERVRLSTVRPDLPAELSTLLAAMLAREARDRPDAAEVVAALRRLIERDDASLELEAPTLGSVHEQAPTLGARTILEVARTLEPERGGIDDAAGTPPDDAAGASDAMDPSDPSVTPTAPRATATRTPGRRVPPPETPTIGRETELAALGRALFATDPSDSSGALVLWGGPGIGKTRLAIELAQLATGETALCDLGEARDAPAMLDAIARTLDRPRTRGATLGSLLSETRLDLLILDRADHVAAELARALGAARAANASRQARAALPKLIVTSRVRIRSTTISAHEVLPLSVTAGTGDVGGNSERSAAGALFHFHARAHLDDTGGEASAEGAAEQERSQAIEAIARALDGVPLALELAAANVGVLGLSGIVRRRVRPLELVGGDEPATRRAPGGSGAEGIAGSAADENVSMATALWWSWRALGPDEASLAARCALLRGTFGAEHAEAIAPASWGPGRALAALRGLRDRSVLAGARQAGETRLAMYGAVRDFAFARLVERGELADAWARHAEHFARWSAPLEAAVLAGTDASAARALTAEATNLLAAAEHALALQPPRAALALRCLAALGPIASERAPLEAFLTLSSAALAAHGGLQALDADAGADASAREVTDRIRVHQARGRFRTLLGEAREGRAELERAVELATDAGDTIALGRALIDLGVSRHRDGDVAAAEEHYLAARALLEPAHDELHVARAIGNVAVVAHDRGALEDAAALYRDAIERLERLDDPRVLGNFEMNAAILDQEAGRLGQAKARALRAVELVARTSDLRLLAATYDVLAVLVEEIGALDEALEWHERAIAAFERSVERRAEARCRARTATLLARLGRERAAEDQRRRALRLLRDDDPITQAIVHAQLALMPLGEAEAALARGDRDTARRLAVPLAAVLAEAEATARDLRFAHSSDDLRALVRIHRPSVERLRRGE